MQRVKLEDAPRDRRLRVSCIDLRHCAVVAERTSLGRVPRMHAEQTYHATGGSATGCVASARRYLQVYAMMFDEKLQGDWWWSFTEEPSAGERWQIRGGVITRGDEELPWSETPEGIRVEQEGQAFIVIGPARTTDRTRTADLFEQERGWLEGGMLVPFAEAEAEGWTSAA